MNLRTNKLPSWVLKIDFGEFDEAMYRGVKMSYEIILCILSIEKSELDEVA
jgi:hypothetical protein